MTLKMKMRKEEKQFCDWDGSPGLVVLGGDSCTDCRGFESQHHILDGHFSHIFVLKIA